MTLSLLYGLGLLVALAYAAPPQVQIGNATLVGLDITGFKLDFFGGMIFIIFLCVCGVQGSSTAIPYAEPPLGNLRLKPPVLQTQLSVSPFDASSFGPGCLQTVGRSIVSSHLLRVLMCIGYCCDGVCVLRGLFNH
jgi:acetylcholinesterase